MFNELREFASFTAREQRYIRRSLDIANKNTNVLPYWSRDLDEVVSIQEQMETYDIVSELRKMMPAEFDSGMIGSFMAPLIELTVADLKQDHIDSFRAYRFLYERLFGALVRPWLPSTFLAAAAVPDIEPHRRKLLLQSVKEEEALLPGWTKREPTFIPEWVEKVE